MAEKFGQARSRSDRSGRARDSGPTSRSKDTSGTGADNFVKRFDANSYLYITKAMDYFDLLDRKEDPEVFKGLERRSW